MKILFNPFTSKFTVAPDTTSSAKGINPQTGATYTLVAGDIDDIIDFSGSDNISVSIPTNAEVDFAVGARIDCLRSGIGNVVFSPNIGVTVISQNYKKRLNNNTWGSLIKKATDTWVLIGDLLSSALYGYFAGGYTGASVATAHMVTFSNGVTNINTVSNLSLARRFLSGLSDFAI